MKHDSVVLKTRVIKTDTDRVAVPSPSYLDFFLYCDPDDRVIKLLCKDHASRLIYRKGVNDDRLRPIDYERDIINIVIVSGNGNGTVNYSIIINLIEDLKTEYRQNISMKAKVLEWASKYGFEVYYYIN